MNRTSFPEVRTRNWLNQTQMQMQRGGTKVSMSARQTGLIEQDED